MQKVTSDKLLEKIRFLETRVRDLENLLPGAEAGLPPLSPELIYRTILHLSPAAISIVRLDDSMIYDVSNAYCQITGLSREEIIGKTSRQLGLWPDIDRGEIINLLVRNGQYKNLELTSQKKDGTLMTVLQSAEIVTIGNARYAIAISHDITAHREVENALLNERDFSKAIIDSLPGWFYVVDDQLRFLLWNNNFKMMTGYSDDEIRKMTVMDFHAESERDAIAAEIKEVFRLGEHNAEADVALKDGSVRTFFFSSKRLHFRDTVCIVGTAIDMTSKKQMEIALKRFTEDLEDTNIALRVLMTKRDEEQKEIEEKLQTNVNDLVMPYLKKMKQISQDERYKHYLNVL